MSNYNQNTFFGPKDSLTTGDPAKIIKGTEFDSEFAAISVAIATKFDAGNIATNTQAAQLSSDAVLLSPVKLKHALENGTYDLAPSVTKDGEVLVLASRQVNTGTGLTGGGDLSTNRTLALSHLGIQSLTDPNADRILFWDDSANASAWLTVDNGLLLTGTLLRVNHAQIDHNSLLNFVASEHVNHNNVSIVAGNGMTGGGSIAASRTITLGTPGTLSDGSSNNVTATSHTHQVIGFEPVLASNRKRQIFVQSGTPSGPATGDLWIF